MYSYNNNAIVENFTMPTKFQAMDLKTKILYLVALIALLLALVFIIRFLVMKYKK
jgi:hypothetical protein